MLLDHPVANDKPRLQFWQARNLLLQPRGWLIRQEGHAHQIVLRHRCYGVHQAMVGQRVLAIPTVVIPTVVILMIVIHTVVWAKLAHPRAVGHLVAMVVPSQNAIIQQAVILVLDVRHRSGRKTMVLGVFLN